MRYYDIHTHQASSAAHICTIRTVMAGREQPPHEGVFSIGVHPWYPYSVELVREYATDVRCVAIGECGLDTLTDTPLAEQMRLFEAQITLSEQLQKPLIIHCVKAFDQVLRLRQMLVPRQRWVVHGFRKGPQLAQQILDSGIDLSFGAALLSAGPALQNALKLVPLDRLLFETDNQTTHSIEAIYEVAAHLKGCTLEVLLEAVERKVSSVFGL